MQRVPKRIWICRLSRMPCVQIAMVGARTDLRPKNTYEASDWLIGAVLMKMDVYSQEI